MIQRWRLISFLICRFQDNSLCAVNGALLLALLSNALLASTFVAVVIVAIWWERARLTRRDLGPADSSDAALYRRFQSRLRGIRSCRADGAEFPTLIQRLILLGRTTWADAAIAIAPIRLSFAYPRWALIQPRLCNGWERLPRSRCSYHCGGCASELDALRLLARCCSPSWFSRTAG